LTKGKKIEEEKEKKRKKEGRKSRKSQRRPRLLTEIEVASSAITRMISKGIKELEKN